MDFVFAHTLHPGYADYKVLCCTIHAMVYASAAETPKTVNRVGTNF